MRRSFLCPDVFDNCTHTMVVNRRGEIIGCAEYVPNGLTAWQAETREADAFDAMGKAFNAREELAYMLRVEGRYSTDMIARARMEARQWQELHNWLMESIDL